MKKLSLKQIGILMFLVISIALAIYLLTITKNTYLKCNSKKEETFYMKIDRPHHAFIYDNPYFIDGDWYTMFNEIYEIGSEIVIRDKNEIFGDQFFYESMSLNRYSLSMRSYKHGNIGNCIEIKKAKQKI